MIQYLLILCFSTAPAVKDSPVVSLEGTAQGTSWHIMYADEQQRNVKPEIESTLQDIDKCLSIYRRDSEISLFNKSTSYQFQLPYFYPVLKKSAEVYAATNGAFDPTVMPLTEAYRLGKRTGQPWWNKTDSLLQYVGFSNIIFNENGVRKLKDHVRLDFDGIAQGYSVDVLATLLESKGIYNYLVEIGGEVRCRGRKNAATGWTIAIDDPLHPEGKALIVTLNNRAATTAGNYRDHYRQNGQTFSHIINPKTGFSRQDTLLSVTVFADDAITADAYDTAFMVMGLSETKAFLAQHPHLDAYLIYINKQGQVSSYATAGVFHAKAQRNSDRSGF